uniref:Uncharacterized protein n=1 Tax=Arundo donax TaxID=35708 RepID=A0A0A9APR9_ARUDO
MDDLVALNFNSISWEFCFISFGACIIASMTWMLYTTYSILNYRNMCGIQEKDIQACCR